MDWRFRRVARTAPPGRGAGQLAEHWAAQLTALGALAELLNKGIANMYVPPELAPAADPPRAVGLALLAMAPASGFALLAASRRRGGLAGQLWAEVCRHGVVHPLVSDVIATARPDLQRFAAQCAQRLLRAGMPDAWAEDAIRGPWRIVTGSRFHRDILAAARQAEVPFAAVRSGASLAVHGLAGVRCTDRDRVLLLLLLFFGPTSYAAALPDCAPAQLATAARAPWLTAMTFTTTTTSTATP
jgi:hypothetical protein